MYPTKKLRSVQLVTVEAFLLTDSTVYGYYLNYANILGAKMRSVLSHIFANLYIIFVRFFYPEICLSCIPSNVFSSKETNRHHWLDQTQIKFWNLILVKCSKHLKVQNILYPSSIFLQKSIFGWNSNSTETLNCKRWTLRWATFFIFVSSILIESSPVVQGHQFFFITH